MAFRIAGRDIAILWCREMLCGIDAPQCLEVRSAGSVMFDKAIAFTITACSEQYVRNLSLEVAGDRLAHAAGSLGSSADYSYRDICIRCRNQI